MGYGLILSRLDSLVMYHLKRMWICKTEHEKREAWKPDSLPYANLVPSDMVVATIALCYAIMAPMVLPFTIAYFACAWLVMRNQVGDLSHFHNLIKPEFGILVLPWFHFNKNPFIILFTFLDLAGIECSFSCL